MTDEQVSSIMGSEDKEMEAEIEAYEHSEDGFNAWADTSEDGENEPPGDTVETTAENEAEEKAQNDDAEVKQEIDTNKDAVPLAVHLDLKSEYKELKQELKALQEQMTTLREPPKQEAPDGPPKFQPTVSKEDNPAQYLEERTEYLERRAEWLEGKLGKVSEKSEESEKVSKQQQAYNQFRQTVQNAEADFARKTPDYEQAVDWMYTQNTEQAREVAKAQGYNVDDPQISQQISQSVARSIESLAMNALRNGKNPAEAFYSIAKARGYAKDESPSDGLIDRVQRGQSKQSLSQISGSRPAEKTGDEGSGDFIKDMQTLAGLQ